MSAFIVGNESLSKLAAGLEFYDQYNRYGKKLDEATARKIVNGWAAMNREAIKQRYGDTEGPAKLPKVLPAPPSRMQFLKSLQCLGYQCSEGDVGEKCFVEERKMLDEYIANVTSAIVSDLPEYNNAKWE